MVKKIGLTALCIVCLSIWTPLFIIIFQEPSNSIGNHSHVRSIDRMPIVINDESIRSFRVDAERLTADTNVRNKENVIRDIKVGDAISYGEGVSIDDLLKELGVEY